MDDPLLSSLCNICHIDPPIYTCPRCSSQTCSLKCSKRHKIWATCNGLRDPTVFKPMSQVATASGLDHDYNFIHGIEIGKQRTEKVLIEDLEIVDRRELEAAKQGINIKSDSFKRSLLHGDEKQGKAGIENSLVELHIEVITAPKGMRRNQENTTHWIKKSRSIAWQVEWMRDGERRDLHVSYGNRSVRTSYLELVEEERKLAMTDEEIRIMKLKKSKEALKRAAIRKRLEKEGQSAVPAQDTKVTNLKRGQKDRRRDSKKRRLEREAKGVSAVPEPLPQEQEPENEDDSDDSSELPMAELEIKSPASIPEAEATKDHHFYLHKPLTRACFGKVLHPIDPEIPLSDILRNRQVLEFPTIYVLDTPPNALPEGFMLENKYLEAVGDGNNFSSFISKMSRTSEEEGSDKDDSTSDSSASDDSSSDESSDDNLDEGEIMQ